eukprot:jgi/Mesvir1/8190/Mv12486-RA.1
MPDADPCSPLGENGSPLGIKGERPWRLKISVLEARHLHPAGNPVTTKCVVTVDGIRHRTRQGFNPSPVWHQTFSWPLPHIRESLDTLIDIRLFDAKQALVGAISHLRVRDIWEKGDRDDGQRKLGEDWYTAGVAAGQVAKFRSAPSPQVKLELSLVRGDEECQLNLFCGTWNMGNARPPEDLSAWIPNDARHDLVVVGAQECVYEPRPQFSSCEDDWLSTLLDAVGVRYSVLAYKSLGAIRLAALVRDDARVAVASVKKDTEATGVGRVMGNKGGVAISLLYWDTSLCFITAHMAAHAGQHKVRNLDYAEVVHNLRIGDPRLDVVSQFEHVFWMGDLNYRLHLFPESSHSKDGSKRRPTEAQFAQVTDAIANGSLDELLAFDELRREMAAGKAFYRFVEGDICFPPTFKMVKGETRAYNAKRLPAWTDRILEHSSRSDSWRVLQQLSYDAVFDIVSSDHKPVSACYTVMAHALSPDIHRPDEHACGPLLAGLPHKTPAKTPTGSNPKTPPGSVTPGSNSSSSRGTGRHSPPPWELAPLPAPARPVPAPSVPTSPAPVLPLSHWVVTFEYLRASAVAARDRGGTSDPYCVILGPSVAQEVATGVKHQTLHPRWEAWEIPPVHLKSLSVSDLRHNMLSISLMDWDKIGSNQRCGSCVLHLADAFSEMEAAGATCHTHTFETAITFRGVHQGRLHGRFRLAFENNAATNGQVAASGHRGKVRLGGARSAVRLKMWVSKAVKTIKGHRAYSRTVV